MGEPGKKVLREVLLANEVQAAARLIKPSTFAAVFVGFLPGFQAVLISDILSRKNRYFNVLFSVPC